MMRKSDEAEELRELLSQLDEDMVKSAYAAAVFLATLHGASLEAKQWALETVALCLENEQAPDLAVWSKAIEGWE
jgi:hypothetical protein